MVSQNQENTWDNSPSRTSSVLSLDGRQRPPAAKTPPSYYDAVRSRHSLSQPVNKPCDGSKQDKSLHLQQVKYNSLPRPLPQRYAQASGDSQPPRHAWTEGRYENSGTWTRQEYDSPPKPANHVPVQPRPLQDVKHTVKHAEGFQQRTSEDMNASHRDSSQTFPLRREGRIPLQTPYAAQNGREAKCNTLPRRDSNSKEHSGLLKRCYPMTPNGTPIPPCHSYSNKYRGVPNGTSNYEPRYTKSGKLYPTRPANEPTLPPPAVSLRTGPLGSYPDSQTLRRTEVPPSGPYPDKSFRPAPNEFQKRNDVSQQIYVDTRSHMNGHVDHLATPYRIPQFSPENSRQPTLNNAAETRKEAALLTVKSPRNGSAMAFRSPQGSTTSPRQLENQGYQQGPRMTSEAKNFTDHSAIYANHQMYPCNGSMSSDHLRYENHTPSDGKVLYPTHHLPGRSNHDYTNSAFHQGRYPPSQFSDGYRDVYHQVSSPGAASKPRHMLPEPSDMMMVTETRGWNGQSNSYSKDVVKPTPRLPRCVNNGAVPDATVIKAPTENGHMRKTFSSSTASLCSDGSSSVSSRRQPSHEDSPWERMKEEMKSRKDKGSIFCASPWEREEKEKMQREQLLGARRARDQEIAYLESIPERTEKQEEWLRILRLEREFQRRAEQEGDDDDDDEGSESSDSESERLDAFNGDKLTVIPNERLGLKLLDDLLESSTQATEKHFIPLEVAIPQVQTSTMPALPNLLHISSEPEAKPHQIRPPVPAPRPSKSVARNDDPTSDSEARTRPESSLTRLDICDHGEYYCDDTAADWLIEVNSFETRPRRGKGDDLKDDQRIYENIRPVEYQLRSLNLKSSYSSHTLPKPSSDKVAPKPSPSKKPNGLTRSSSNALPFLYSASKARSAPAQGIPSDLEDQSPEFKKMWLSRPEKLTFRDKIRKFSYQAGEGDLPRDRVKNSRAQREIENKFSEAQLRSASVNA